ncbi:hypothetical protein TSAR_012456 [Trichomalopsis sarcophagae]|uniref:Uncharacterized protein n=1 Tax=Trichomalopsis sarcophagae TaxID=543379 RepID=A0A232FGI9_9HYME|nr:hypothetical protein TSAR_012456 [Trichomalopsis sarcophagae]
MYCPTGSGSLCKYQKALSESKEQDYVHPPAISKAILDEIEDVFKKLSESELLRKGFGGQTQSANESFNNVLWNIAPRTDFVGLETLEISAYIANIMFLTGWKGLLFLMSNLDIEPGKNALSAAVMKNQLRIKEAEKQPEINSKEARKLRRQMNIPTADNEYI